MFPSARNQISKVVKLSVLVAVLSTVVGCATNPVTGESDFVLLSEEQEVNIGKQSHQSILKEYKIYDDPKLQGMINELGQKLAQGSHRNHLNFSFTLLDSPEVNAFALPGGYIYITRGIMAYMNNEEELAGVLGHEIGHVTARHGVRQHSAQTTVGILGAIAGIATGSQGIADISNQVGNAFVRGYGRNHELEADRLGAEYLARTGYDPQKMLGVVGILKDQEQFEIQRAKDEGRTPRVYHGVFSTHPRNDQRLQEVVKAADKFKTPNSRTTNPRNFLQSLNGMVFGHAQDEGIVQGNEFYHHDLNLAVRFPEGWRLKNNPTQLLAIHPDRTAAIIFEMARPNAGEAASSYLRRSFPTLDQGRFLGKYAYAGVVENDTPFGRQPVRAAAVAHGNKVFLIRGFAKDRLPGDEFFSTIQSISKLNRTQRKLAQARKIKLVRAKPGDTIAKLARQSNLVDYAEAQLRLLNGMYPDGEPKPGQLIKIIE